MTARRVTKDQVLAEIKRTAAENGGTPLGVGLFERATGIKASAWQGRYWVRWGEALAEAGFQPHTLNQAFERSAVIEQFIGIVRRYGRLPVWNEVRFAKAQDPSLPQPNTFASHLGPTNAARIETLRAFCAEHQGYDDVLALLGEPDRDEVTEATPSSESEWGFVYLMKSGAHYKIGRSNSAGRREYEIALQMPDKLAKVHEIRTDDPPGIEAYWHRRFADRRKGGEWFALTADDVAAFRRRKFM